MCRPYLLYVFILTALIVQTLRNDGNVLISVDTAGRVLELAQLLVCYNNLRNLMEHMTFILNCILLVLAKDYFSFVLFHIIIKYIYLDLKMQDVSKYVA